jgi:DNA repair protein RecN (Recombination protein N)
LAIKGLLIGKSKGDKLKTTLVFDEIDAGIGGVTAYSVADRLRELAQSNQVIVITHLAQIAAIADKHFKVEKFETDGLPETRVRVISGDERVEEIARLLSGSTNEEALAHAKKLLEIH